MPGLKAMSLLDYCEVLARLASRKGLFLFLFLSQSFPAFLEKNSEATEILHVLTLGTQITR